ncbi:MAG: hypothetical protein KatS3mg131_1461 [Candidatus Tectimicrobiota bacterium]|nr:MAG: hypothetical protein KatS3mg131_1461 [Candidatus Tectomicrobia bacterium]
MRLCVRCAQHERTCCQGTEVLVTDGDIARIAAYTGRHDFWEFRRPADPWYLTPQPADPNWLLYTARADGTRPVLKHQASGDCVFLTAQGCSLPLTVRPLVCRLYPYDYTERGITGTVPGCPLYLLEEGEDLFTALGMRLEEAQQWRRQLYQELRRGRVWRENRHHLRSAAGVPRRRLQRRRNGGVRPARDHRSPGSDAAAAGM